MDRNALIEALEKSDLIEGRLAANQLKMGAVFEISDRLARAKDESLVLTYKIRLKNLKNHSCEYSQRLTSSVSEFVDILERDDPEYLRTIRVMGDGLSNYLVWQIPESDIIAGCMYTEPAQNV